MKIRYEIQINTVDGSCIAWSPEYQKFINEISGAFLDGG